MLRRSCHLTPKREPKGASVLLERWSVSVRGETHYAEYNFVWKG